MSFRNIDFKRCDCFKRKHIPDPEETFTPVSKRAVSETIARIMEISKEPSVIRDKETCRGKPNLRIKIPKTFSI